MSNYFLLALLTLRSTLYPYTTLFRSGKSPDSHDAPGRRLRPPAGVRFRVGGDRKSTRLNSSHLVISYDVFCFKIKIAWFILIGICITVGLGKAALNNTAALFVTAIYE